MELATTTDMLTSGLRALGVLARYAPVAVEELAQLSGTSSRQATALIETLVQHGYAECLKDTGTYVLTDLALALVPVRQGDNFSLSLH